MIRRGNLPNDATVTADRLRQPFPSDQGELRGPPTNLAAFLPISAALREPLLARVLSPLAAIAWSVYSSGTSRRKWSRRGLDEADVRGGRFVSRRRKHSRSMSDVDLSPAAIARRERVILFCLAAVHFTSIVDFMVVMPLGPQLEKKLGIGPAEFGMIVAAYTYAAGLAGLVATIVLDRFARRTAFLAIFAGFILGTFACGLANSYSALLIARFLTGTFGGILGGIAMAIIGDVFPENRRGTATGLLMSAFAIASIAGVPLGLTLGLRYGWQAPFLVLAVLCLPILAMAFRALPRLDDHLQHRSSEPPLDRLKEMFSHPNHLRAFTLMTALTLGALRRFPLHEPVSGVQRGVAGRPVAVRLHHGRSLEPVRFAAHRPPLRPLRQATRVSLCRADQCGAVFGTHAAAAVAPRDCCGAVRAADAQQCRTDGSRHGAHHLQRGTAPFAAVSWAPMRPCSTWRRASAPALPP